MTATRALTSGFLVRPRGFPRDPCLTQRRQADAAIEHAVTAAGDLLEQSAVDARHHEARTLCTAILRRQRSERFGVGFARTLDLKTHQCLKGRGHAPRKNIGCADAETRSEEHTSELQSPCNLVC